MEKITAIEEVFDYKKGKTAWSPIYCGFKIKTDKQVILFLINNRANCCESWGHFASEDDIQSFIGAKIKDIKLVDDALSSKSIELVRNGFDAGGVMFVNIETDKGTLQLTAYNDHNGYYSHDAFIISEQLIHEVNL